MDKFFFWIFGTGATKSEMNPVVQILFALISIGAPVLILLSLIAPSVFYSLGIGPVERVCPYRPELPKCK